MKKYILGKDTTSYKFVTNKKQNRLTKHKELLMQSGRGFLGQLVYLRMPYGFQPMVQVIVGRKAINAYYYPKQVRGARVEGKNVSLPRAGKIGGNWAARNNPFGLSAGEIEGNVRTAPQVENMMSGADGNSTKPRMDWGVQAGQVYNTNPLVPTNPNQVIGGEIEGVEEAVSHEYFSNFDGNGVQAGQMFDYGAMGAENPYSLEAGEIEGNTETMPASHNPQSFSSVSGWGWNYPNYVHAYRYPNILPYGYVNTNVSPELVDYENSVFSSANGNSQAPAGFDSLQAGQSFNWGAMGKPNPFGLEAGVIEGNVETAPASHNPQSFSSANGDKQQLSQEEMDALHKSSDKKGGNFWDWLKSDDAKKLANDSVGIAAALFNKKQQEQIAKNENKTQAEAPSKAAKDEEKRKNTILGMHPVTFGLVAVGVIAAATVATMMLKKGKK